MKNLPGTSPLGQELNRMAFTLLIDSLVSGAEAMS